MAGARDQAEQTLASLAGARADRNGLEEPTDQEVTADPSVTAAFQERRGALEARIGRLEAAWDELLAELLQVLDRPSGPSRKPGSQGAVRCVAPPHEREGGARRSPQRGR